MFLYSIFQALHLSLPFYLCFFGLRIISLYFLFIQNVGSCFVSQSKKYINFGFFCTVKKNEGVTRQIKIVILKNTPARDCRENGKTRPVFAADEK